jgi:hypothetical protein
MAFSEASRRQPSRAQCSYPLSGKSYDSGAGCVCSILNTGAIEGLNGEANLKAVLSFRTMNAKGITPILNVSDMAASFAWFEKWGWKKCWDWGTPATFGAVGSGECEIFLCQGAHGSRGRGTNASTFGPDGDEEADKGVWMSVWVEDVDEVHRRCVAAGLDVTFPPSDMPWNVREMHVRHPDGHVFRVSKGIEDVAQK